ncbi:MAG: periplasmic heavy metal sensor [Hyphomicrobium sp.]
MTTQSATPEGGRPRWFKVALIASLALNLVFIGGFAKAFWHHRHGPFGGPGMMGFARDFEPDRRKQLIEEFKAGRQAIRPLRQSVRDAWSEANKVLTVEPFDKANFKAAMDRVTAAELRVRSAMADAVVETASKMSADERSKFQVWLERRKGHKFGRHFNRDRDDE